jgi:hypothetical protein
MNTGRTWVWDGNRRQTGPIVGVRRLYVRTPVRSQVVPHRPHQCLCPHPMPGDPSSSWTGDTSQQCASQQEMARLDRDGAHQGGNHLASTWERAGKRPGVQTSGPVVLFPPLRLVVYEDKQDNTFVAYDSFVSLLAQYQREEITQVARLFEQQLEAQVAEVTAEGEV